MASLVSAAQARAKTAAVAQGRRFRLGGAGGAIATRGPVADCVSESRSNAMSLADWKRSSGDFARQWATIRAKAGDSMALSSGSLVRIPLTRSALELPWNARSPVSIS